MAEPHRFVFVLVIIGINATQGALFGYAVHRAARNALLWHRAEQDRRELTFRLGDTADKRCKHRYRGIPEAGSQRESRFADLRSLA